MTVTPLLLGGRYEVGDIIGHGGMAEVHAGRDTRLGRAVAIKMLRPDLTRDPAFLARFRREAQSSAGLNHPSIVAVYDSGEEHTTDASGSPVLRPYIVMEYVAGRTLRDVLSESTGAIMDPIRAMRMTEGILTALDYSHRHGIVHRDIKPANVMLTDDGDIKVMDFGIARAIADSGATMTQTQAVIGTAQYLSPEQARGENVDARSDLYSTGCLLYELLTGRPPFVGDSAVSLAYQHVGEQPQPPSLHRRSVPPDLDAVALHALVKDREARYQSAEEFREDLVNARLGRPVSTAALGTAAAAAESASTITLPRRSMTLTDSAAAPLTGNTASLPPIGHDPDDEPPKRHAASYLLLSLAVVAALVLVGFAAKAIVAGTSGGPQTTVPSVVKLTRTAAVAALQAKGLTANVQTVTSPATKDTVVDQSPVGGAKIATAATVTIDVSSGPGQVGVPDVTGFSLAAARVTLGDVGLVVSKVVKVDGSTVPGGNVVATTPAAASIVSDGSPVVVQVSSGKVVVPSVVGQDRAKAQTTLSDLGLRTSTTFAGSSRPEGTVLRQTHTGDTVASGTLIKLVVAQATAPSSRPPSSTSTAPPSSSSSSTSTSPPTSTTTSTTSSGSSTTSPTGGSPSGITGPVGPLGPLQTLGPLSSLSPNGQ